MNDEFEQAFKTALKYITEYTPQRPKYIISQAVYDRILLNDPSFMLPSNYTVSNMLPDNVDGYEYNGE